MLRQCVFVSAMHIVESFLSVNVQSVFKFRFMNKL